MSRHYLPTRFRAQWNSQEPDGEEVMARAQEVAGSLSEHRVDKCDNVRLIWNAKHKPCDLEKQRGVFQCLKLWQKMIHSMLKAYTEELK